VERKLTLENRLAEVSRAEEAILQAITEHGFSEADSFAVKLALEEALANAIKHGNAGDPEKHVTVEFCIEGGCVRISISDEGEGFDPADVPDPTLDENLTKPYGRGVMLMRTYMDEVSYNQAGNCVTMIKRCGG
jgi:serine/threonine-protein kinase RsbW